MKNNISYFKFITPVAGLVFMLFISAQSNATACFSDFCDKICTGTSSEDSSSQVCCSRTHTSTTCGRRAPGYQGQG